MRRHVSTKMLALFGTRFVRCAMLVCLLLVPTPHGTQAEGSVSIYPSTIPPTSARANIEWRTSKYGPTLIRRTLLRVYAQKDEYILVASSAIAAPAFPGDPASRGDVLIYAPDNPVGNQIGNETIPLTPSFSCLAQRAVTGNLLQGRIANRNQEVAGPDTVIDVALATPGNTDPNAYVPCYYRAPENGSYALVFYGPSGGNSNAEPVISGEIDGNPDDFSTLQRTSVTAWNVTVRTRLDSTDAETGRLYTYYLTANTGGNGRQLESSMYVVTTDGFQYKLSSRSIDPFGWVAYANRVGFLDGKQPLYRDVLALPDMSTQQQNQLMGLQGETITMADPEFPMFFQLPSNLTIQYLGIPLAPVIPRVESLAFAGPFGTDLTLVGRGGVFSFETTVIGVYQLVVSRDGIDFDPTNPRNQVLRGTATQPGRLDIPWDGKDSQGQDFPVGNVYRAAIEVHGGEAHFPALDIENSVRGGSTIEMINPPGPDCYAFPKAGGGTACTGAFYDDRGYRTSAGVTVGTVNGSLCGDNAAGNPPQPLFAPPTAAYDSAGTERSYGFDRSGNSTNDVCDADGGFGDKKGLDKWTYYPSNKLIVPLRIVDPSAVVLSSFTAQSVSAGVEVRWTTAAERNSASFQVLRSENRNLANARLVTPQPIAARGGPTAGAAYVWLDQTAQTGRSYYYWLQERELSGRVQEYGPVTTVQPLSGTRSWIYLPFLWR